MPGTMPEVRLRSTQQLIAEDRHFSDSRRTSYIINAVVSAVSLSNLLAISLT